MIRGLLLLLLVVLSHGAYLRLGDDDDIFSGIDCTKWANDPDGCIRHRSHRGRCHYTSGGLCFNTPCSQLDKLPDVCADRPDCIYNGTNCAPKTNTRLLSDDDKGKPCSAFNGKARKCEDDDRLCSYNPDTNTCYDFVFTNPCYGYDKTRAMCARVSGRCTWDNFLNRCVDIKVTPTPAP